MTSLASSLASSWASSLLLAVQQVAPVLVLEVEPVQACVPAHEQAPAPAPGPELELELEPAPSVAQSASVQPGLETLLAVALTHSLGPWRLPAESSSCA